MREKFPCDQKQSKDRCTELDPFLQAFLSSQRALSPASCRVPAHTFCIPKKEQVDQCTGPGDGQHWNPKLVGVETRGWSGGGGGNECGEPESRTYPADEYCRSTNTLDYGQTKRSHGEKPLGLPEPKMVSFR